VTQGSINDQIAEDVSWHCFIEGCRIDGRGGASLNEHVSTHIPAGAEEVRFDLDVGSLAIKAVTWKPREAPPVVEEDERCPIHRGWPEPCMACVAGGYT